MHRIDSVNARPNLNGAGKNGFSDNTDLSGVDATYLTPEIMNALQEELANVIEGAGIVLNKAQNNQLLAGIRNLFQSYTDNEVNALSAAIDTLLNNEIAARQAADTIEANTRWTADNALQGQISTETNRATTAENSLIYNQNTAFRFNGFNQATFNSILDGRQMIMQFGWMSNATEGSFLSFPFAFPTAPIAIIPCAYMGNGSSTYLVSGGAYSLSWWQELATIKTGFHIHLHDNNNAPVTCDIFFIAIG